MPIIDRNGVTKELRQAVVTWQNRNHTDVAVGPRLLRRPFEQVVHVLTFLAVEEAEGPPEPLAPRQLAITWT
jgi:hypothetical protein